MTTLTPDEIWDTMRDLFIDTGIALSANRNHLWIMGSANAAICLIAMEEVERIERAAVLDWFVGDWSVRHKFQNTPVHHFRIHGSEISRFISDIDSVVMQTPTPIRLSGLTEEKSSGYGFGPMRDGRNFREDRPRDMAGWTVATDARMAKTHWRIPAESEDGRTNLIYVARGANSRAMEEQLRRIHEDTLFAVPVTDAIIT